MAPLVQQQGRNLIRPTLELKAMLKHCRENVYTQ